MGHPRLTRPSRTVPRNPLATTFPARPSPSRTFKHQRAPGAPENAKVKGEVLVVSDDVQRKVFVGGFKDLAIEVVRDYFAKFGEIEELDAASHDNKGKPRGYAFVRFMWQADSEKVLENDEHQIGGRKCNVRRAAARAPKTPDDLAKDKKKAEAKAKAKAAGKAAGKAAAKPAARRQKAEQSRSRSRSPARRQPGGLQIAPGYEYRGGYGVQPSRGYVPPGYGFPPPHDPYDRAWPPPPAYGHHGYGQPPEYHYGAPPPGYGPPPAPYGYGPPPARGGYGGGYDYPPPDRGYPPADRGYPPPDRGYPPPDRGYPPPERGYPPPERGYPPLERGYPPPDRSYPPPERGYVRDYAPDRDYRDYAHGGGYGPYGGGHHREAPPSYYR